MVKAKPKQITATLGTVLLVMGGIYATLGLLRSDYGDVFGGSLLIVIAVLLLSLRVAVCFDDEPLRITLMPLGKRHVVAYNEISSVSTSTDGPWYGLGYRILMAGERAMLTGGPTIVINYGSRRQLIFSHPG